MDKIAQELLLGRAVSYPTQYDAALLFPIERADARRLLGHDGPGLPFIGWDLWNAYEMSWLNPAGLPRVAILRVHVPCDSPRIIESKSFKLYLNSFTNSRFTDMAEVQSRIRADLGEAVWRGAASGAGVNVSKQNLLRLGVVLYGLRLTVQDIGHVGIAGVAIDALVLGKTTAPQALQSGALRSDGDLSKFAQLFAMLDQPGSMMFDILTPGEGR